MTWNPRNRFGRAICAAAATGVLALLACETPLPEQPDQGPPEPKPLGQQTVGDTNAWDLAIPLANDDSAALDLAVPVAAGDSTVLDLAVPLAAGDTTAPDLAIPYAVGDTTALHLTMPLVLVDGEIVELESLETAVVDGARRGIRLHHLQISPDAIERVEVIKGAQGEALYGEKAANGVVLITTHDTIANPVDRPLPQAAAPERIPQQPLAEALSRNPVLLIDGEIVGREAVEALDPEDIESIEIIKGPAAEALYGERAANGVIRITTRRKQ